MWSYNYSDELYHYGVLGMKWGKRKGNYHSTSLKSSIARHKNEKVDEGFKKWAENAKKRDNAISLGKQANASKMAYEKDRTNKELKKEYKAANKAYKKALGQNTTYRKGVVRKEVGQDASRKYLSEAKRVKKQMNADPSNKQLQKKYNDLMSKHDVERAKARKAVDVATKRSNKKAAFKRTMTMTIKTATATAAVAAGAYAVNRYLGKHDVRLNGQRVTFSTQNISKMADIAKKGREFMSYMY